MVEKKTPGEKPIVIVKAGDPIPSVAESRGDYTALIRESIGDAWRGSFASFDCRVEAPPNPSSAAAFVITGSSSNLPNRERWMLDVEAWLRDVVGSGTPVFGICFGHQLLGQALGGEVTKNPRGREIGTIRVERLADDPILEGIPTSFEANATHIDTVAKLPPGAVALARSSLDDHQAIRFTPAVYGVQFHPEIDADVMRQYIAAREALLVAESMDPVALGRRVTDATFARSILASFIRNVVAS
jgi:GMP synthase (glutamine-hydrolysing)